MIEKVNPSHPDKVADRIAGAIVDLAYQKNDNPKIAVEVLIGHNNCMVIIETSENITNKEIDAIVKRITNDSNIKGNYIVVKQDVNLNKNQENGLKCGDNGIFKAYPLREVDKKLSKVAHDIYEKYPYDGKYILDNEKLIICQSHVNNELNDIYPYAIINPLGYWSGGIDVDSGATNRKLGSDMAESITGGGLHGKDLSKADVTLNIYAFLKAQKTGKKVELSCAIGDEIVDGIEYEKLVQIAKNYIDNIGGFEEFAKWGLY